MTLTKNCLSCQEEKPVTSFHKATTGKYGVRGVCGTCRSVKNKGKQKERRLKSASKRYNISQKELISMYDNQKGLCKICSKEVLLFADKDDKGSVGHIDHCHDTGNVRGILCGNCNNGIGKFNDNIELISKAIDYLRGDLDGVN